MLLGNTIILRCLLTGIAFSQMMSDQDIEQEYDIKLVIRGVSVPLT